MLSLHEYLQTFNSHLKDKQTNKNHFQMGTMVDRWLGVLESLFSVYFCISFWFLSYIFCLLRKFKSEWIYIPTYKHTFVGIRFSCNFIAIHRVIKPEEHSIEYTKLRCFFFNCPRFWDSVPGLLKLVCVLSWVDFIWKG